MIGISTSYFATKGLSIYDSVLRATELGFDVVEFGAAHTFEDNVWKVLERIRKKFSHIHFCIHTLFPPPQKSIWFNPADGLTLVNKKIVENLFVSASIVEAKVISIHPCVFNEISIGNEKIGGFHKPDKGKSKDIELSKNNFIRFVEYINDKSEDYDIKIIIENMETALGASYPSSKNDFQNIFDMFPDIGLLFDVGHALQHGNLSELIELDGNICEIHLHDLKNASDRTRAHYAIKDISFFEPLKKILRKNSVISIFEHGADVSEKEILEEKKLLEKFMAL